MDAREIVVDTRLDAGVLTLTLNRPESRNALNLAMCEQLAAALDGAQSHESVRVVVVRGAGAAFCAGADLHERKRMDESQVLARRMKGLFVYDALERLPMPTIAVVEGAAAGSGAEIAAACDLVVATPAARFWTPEALWGTVGATQRLARIIGPKLAKDLMFTGRRLDANEARDAGLVCRVVEPQQLEDMLAQMCKAIVEAPPLAMRLAKKCIDQSVESERRSALGRELLAIDENLRHSDWRKAIGGFGRGT